MHRLIVSDRTEVPKVSDLIGKKTVIVMVGLPVGNVLSCLRIGSREKLYCEDVASLSELGRIPHKRI